MTLGQLKIAGWVGRGRHTVDAPSTLAHKRATLGAIVTHEGYHDGHTPAQDAERIAKKAKKRERQARKRSRK